MANGVRSGGWLPPKEPQSFIPPSIHAAVSVVQSCLTLYDPMDCSLPGSSVHGSLQARILEWVVIPFSRGSSQPRDWTWVFCITGRFFTLLNTGEAPTAYNNLQWNIIYKSTETLTEYWYWHNTANHLYFKLKKVKKSLVFRSLKVWLSSPCANFVCLPHSPLLLVSSFLLSTSEGLGLLIFSFSLWMTSSG